MDDLVYPAETVVRSAQGIVCIKVDGDECKDLKEIHRVTGFPTGILFNSEGKETTRFVGYTNVKRMTRFLQQAKPTLNPR